MPSFSADLLPPIYWIGGSPCSGKSSIAEALQNKYGLRHFACDAVFSRHAQSALPERQPVLHRIARMSWEEIWLRPVEQLLSDEIAAYHEEFPLLLEDLLALNSGSGTGGQPVIVEGAALLPGLVAPLLKNPRQAIWVVPTPAFQRQHYSQREWAQNLVRETSDPERAFSNWMERDIRFASYVQREAQELGLRVLVVDGEKSLSENQGVVEEHLGLNSL